MSRPNRVFLIDDDEDDCYFFRMALEEMEYLIELDYHQDSNDAIKKLSDENTKVPDLLFLDWNMPKLSGRECLEAIRKLPGYAFVPIIVYSTSRDLENRPEFIQLGASYFLPKPPSIGELRQELQHIFSIDWNMKHA